MSRISIPFDLGIRQLYPEWKNLFSKDGLKEDLIAGATVACIAVPLSLAIALASGVHPSVGLVTAIVGSFVVALFGGTPLAVSGPAAAMAVLVASVVQDYGVGGLLIIGILCGLYQVLTGLFRLGQLVRFVPTPVVAGFTAGIGAIILIGQLPRVLGLAPPDQSHVFDVIVHIKDLIDETRMSSLILALSTIGITFVLPRVVPKLPAPLVAVLIPSLIVYYLDIPVDTIGIIPDSLPMPQVPTLPDRDGIIEILGTSFIVFGLASLETLLSSTAVDKLAKGKRHNPDQELIGQGLGNIASAFFGGIPITGVIARSALNIHAGAKTRRAPIIHAIILVLTVYFLAPVMSNIPMAVLAGVLVSVALRMLHPREFFQLLGTSKFEALIYVITFLAIVFIDLIVGVQAGVAAALLIAAIRLGKARASVHTFESGSPSLLNIEGPLTFLSSGKIESIRSNLQTTDHSQGLVVDISGVTTIDASGASQLIELLEETAARNIKIALQGVSEEAYNTLSSQDKDGKIKNFIAQSDAEALTLLTRGPNQTLDRLIHGVQKFRTEIISGYESLFEKLAEGQSPHTLFITCSDSRINPNLITSTAPGELFIVRNVGNLIPKAGIDKTPAEGAAIEYAIAVLGVKDIVVCGHSGCGAMAELLSGKIFQTEMAKNFPHVALWLSLAKDMLKSLPTGATPEQAAHLNAVMQIDNLKSYPVIHERLRSGSLRIHAWFYDIRHGILEEWDEEQKQFIELGSKAAKRLEKRVEAGVQYQAIPIKPKPTRKE